MAASWGFSRSSDDLLALQGPASPAPITPRSQSSVSLGELPPVPTSAPAAHKLGTSPAANSSSMMRRMRSVLKERQCVTQQEAMARCMQQEHQQGVRKSNSCHDLMSAMRYCMATTQQQNFVSNRPSPFM